MGKKNRKSGTDGMRDGKNNYSSRVSGGLFNESIIGPAAAARATFLMETEEQNEGLKRGALQQQQKRLYMRKREILVGVRR